MKKFFVLFLLIGIFLLYGCFSSNLKSSTTELTVKSNISMSDKADNPPVNDIITMITLEFSQPLNIDTVSGNIKLYKINSAGTPVEEPCIVKVDQIKTALVYITNKKVEKFTEGEEYKIVINNNLKSSTGKTMTKDFTGYFASNYSFNFSGITELNKTRSLIVCISDIHLGLDDNFAECKANKPALVDFLIQIKNSPNIKELIIAGDLIDEWFLPMNYQMKPEADLVNMVVQNNKEIINIFKDIINAGKIKVSYIPGNHDILVTTADIQRILPGISQVRDNVQGLGKYITGANLEIVLEHGHRYNFFCAPDTISNRDITKNTTSILPPGYFFTRIATSSVIEGHPSSSNTWPDITIPDQKNESQYLYYLYWATWKSILSGLPVKESFADKAIIMNGIDGYTETYAINDLIPQQNPATGIIDVNLYKGIQDTWEKRQSINNVKVKIPAKEAITEGAKAGFLDEQSKIQYFDKDASKRIVIFGHSHEARIITYSNLNNKKTIYANSGTWIDNAQGYPTMTFVVVTPQKSGSAAEYVNLYKYSANKTVTQWCEAQAIIK
jgi:UDP-2,3-diacylglucosamine pyrophosphatase LpxH